MNIFVLDKNPEIAARYLCDQHIVKMCLETAQILSTVSDGPYRPTHEKHPCVLWTKAGKDNYNWLVRHGLEISKEYSRRYNKTHKSTEIIEFLETAPKETPDGFTDFVLCMPDEFKSGDPVQSYRDYYKSKTFAKYKYSPKPEWL